MLWVDIALLLVAGFVVFVLATLGNRPFNNVHELGSVSAEWLAAHHRESP
jgi:hypothetical protein